MIANGEASPRPRKRVLVLGVTFVLGVVFAISLIAEGVGMFYLKRTGAETSRFLIRQEVENDRSNRVFDTRTSLAYLDPHLSHSHDPSALEQLEGCAVIPGFTVYGESDDEDVLRIIALGGSTTDPVPGYDWPRSLFELLEAKGVRVQVFNGGVSGYSSNQELLKLIRDVMPLDPDLVVSLSGINDLGFLHSVKGHPMVHPYQRKIMLHLVEASSEPPIVLPNTVLALRHVMSSRRESAKGVNWGPVVRTEPVDQWLRNVRMMGSIAEEFEFNYLCFLQPIMGIGEYALSEKEKEMLEEAIDRYAWRKKNYLEAVGTFYAGASEGMNRLSYCVDLSDAFAGSSGLYRDARHQNVRGVRALADAILDEIEARGFVDLETAPPD